MLRVSSSSTTKITRVLRVFRHPRPILRALVHWRYAFIYKRFRSYTLMGGGFYIDTLRLARHIRDVDGAVVECGTWRGGMVAGLAVVLENERRHYILIDSFEGMPPPRDIDGEAALAWSKDVTGPEYHDNSRASEGDVHQAMALAKTSHYEVRRGWFDAIVPVLAAEGPKIALLRLDGDWYDSTIVCLRNLVPLVVSGGMVVVDDYDAYDGCSLAVHDYLSETKSVAKIKRFGSGVCYIEKP
jgi:O-methyltransferase